MPFRTILVIRTCLLLFQGTLIYSQSCNRTFVFEFPQVKLPHCILVDEASNSTICAYNFSVPTSLSYSSNLGLGVLHSPGDSIYYSPSQSINTYIQFTLDSSVIKPSLLLQSNASVLQFYVMGSNIAGKCGSTKIGNLCYTGTSCFLSSSYRTFMFLCIQPLIVKTGPNPSGIWLYSISFDGSCTPLVSPSNEPVIVEGVSTHHTPSFQPSSKPTSEAPTSSQSPTSSPSPTSPSMEPFEYPSPMPTFRTTEPIVQSSLPTVEPSFRPSLSISTVKPSPMPTFRTTEPIIQSSLPTVEPSFRPSLSISSVKPSFETTTNPSIVATSFSPLLSISPAIDESGSSSQTISSRSTATTSGIIIGSVIGGCFCISLLYFCAFKVRKNVNSVRSDDLTASLLSDNDKISTTQSSHLKSDSGFNQINQRHILWTDIELMPFNLSNQGSFIGQGSFGAVFRARWLNPKTNIPVDVAVKVLKYNNFTESYDNVYRRLADEIAIIKFAEKALETDEHTVKVYDIVGGPISDALAKAFNVGVGSRHVGMVMRYEPGGDLANYLHAKEHMTKSLSLTEKLHILMSLSSSLAYLHSVGVVHGDIKPENILLSSTIQPIVRLADFGVSTVDVKNSYSLFDTTLVQTQNIHGTPRYCAPEMLFNGQSQTVARPSRKTDIYALGIITWEVLTQLKPFDAITSREELSFSVHKGGRPDLSKLSPDIPESIVNMIQQCWSSTRSDRPSAAQCFSICSQHYQTVLFNTFDIFLSHTWSSKPFVAYVFSELSKSGYRVWYDCNNMGHNMRTSMKNGISNSTVFVACVNSQYQSRPNCIFELEEASTLQKPIITLVLESNPFSWADEMISSICSLQSSMFVDVSELATNSCWDSDEGPSPEMSTSLRSILPAMIKLLEENNCFPSMQ